MIKKSNVAVVPIVVLPTSIDQKTLASVKAAGYLPVLTDEPDKIRIIMPHEACGTSDLLMSAFAGVDYATDGAKAVFARELLRRLKAREPKLP